MSGIWDLKEVRERIVLALRCTSFEHDSLFRALSLPRFSVRRSELIGFILSLGRVLSCFVLCCEIFRGRGNFLFDLFSFGNGEIII